MVLQNLGDGQTVVGILSRDVGERGNLDARVHRQILQGLTVVVSHFGGVICHSCGRQRWKPEVKRNGVKAGGTQTIPPSRRADGVSLVSEDTVARGCGPTKCSVSIQGRQQCREKEDAIRFSPHVPTRFQRWLPKQISSRVALPVEISAVFSLHVPSSPEACPGCCGARGRGRKSQGGGWKRGVEAKSQTR